MPSRLAEHNQSAILESARQARRMGKHKKSTRAGSSVSTKKSLVPYYILLSALVLFIGGIRLRLRDMPLERDEGEYAYAGQLMLQGIPPYALAYNMKLPGTYVAYSAMMAVFGQSTTGIHFGLLLVNAVTTVLLFFLMRRLLDSAAAIAAAASYGILSTSPSVLGFAGHATHFVVLAAVAGIFVLLHAISSPKLWKFGCAGVLLGVAFLMKQPGIFFVVFGAIWLAVSAWRTKANIGWRVFARRFAVFGIAGALPVALTCLWMWRAGVFQHFWFWTFTYARLYGGIISLHDAPGFFWNQASGVIPPALPIWLMALVGIVTLLWKRRSSDVCVFAMLFLLCSFLAVCPGFYFREHYFIVILPAIALLAGAAVDIWAKELANRQSLRALRFAPALLFVASFGYAVWQQWDFFFETDPIAACRAEYGNNPFPEAIQIADYLKAHTSPSSTVAILGSEPEIYFYAHRHSATGYIYTYPLMEHQAFAEKMQQEMIAEIERARPEFIVMVSVPFSWLGRPDSPSTIFDWAQKYIAGNYKLDGLVDILDDSQYRWGADAAAYHPQSPYTVRVFRR